MNTEQQNSNEKIVSNIYLDNNSSKKKSRWFNIISILLILILGYFLFKQSCNPNPSSIGYTIIQNDTTYIYDTIWLSKYTTPSLIDSIIYVTEIEYIHDTIILENNEWINKYNTLLLGYNELLIKHNSYNIYKDTHNLNNIHISILDTIFNNKIYNRYLEVKNIQETQIIQRQIEYRGINYYYGPSMGINRRGTQYLGFNILRVTPNNIIGVGLGLNRDLESYIQGHYYFKFQ